MSIHRRKFLGLAALGSGLISATNRLESMPAVIDRLQPLKAPVVPITIDERKDRIARAQQLMEKLRIDAIFMEGTASCFYFTGMRWGQSERTFGLLIPSKGKIAYICPKFEEDRARELINPAFGDEVTEVDPDLFP